MNKIKLIFTGLLGYINIVLFPVLIAMILSIVVYLTMPGIIGVAASLFLCAIGLITGLIMALRVLKRRGPSAFVPNTYSDEEDNTELENTEEM
ncbi:hypothetical protein [Aurantibacillus circumpalustris]|uniref:hypothetical protein n=1 Tax=Aurantibacillus circumpalustris TaxID=3036359 RepID=UPI00295C1F53|nr:hypothetical protein [Aurantibacillus circumpalustris]